MAVSCRLIHRSLRRAPPGQQSQSIEAIDHAAGPTTGDAVTASGFTLGSLLSGVAAVSVLFGGFAVGIRDTVSQKASHVSPREARLSLPEGASDVSVHRGGRGTIWYDFAIDERGFWEWANSLTGSVESEAAQVTIKPIDGTHTIGAIGAQFGAVQIERGWYYDWSREDRGIHYAYDAENGRAYYFAHSH